MTQVVLILIAIIIVLAGLAFLGFRRSAMLKKEIRNRDAKIAALARNLAAIKEANKDDVAAREAVMTLDKEIVNAKTTADAARIRRRFVAGAFDGL